MYRQLRALWPLLPGKEKLAVVAISSLGLVAFSIYLAHLIRLLADSLVAGQVTEVYRWLQLSVVVIGGELVLRYIRVWAAGSFAEHSVAAVRERITGHILRLPLPEYTRLHAADYISRLTNDLARLQDLANNTLGNLIFLPLAGVCAAVYMLISSWQLTLVVVLGTPLLLVVASVLSAPISRLSKRLQDRMAEVTVMTQEAVQGMEVARAFNLGEHLESRFAGAIREVVACQWALVRYRVGMGATSFILLLLSFFLCFGVGGWLVIQGRMSLGELMAFVQLMNHLTDPMSRVPQLLASLRGELAATERAFDILSLPAERVGGQVAHVELPALAKAVEFRNVTFTYPDRSEPALLDVSFAVEPGKTVALVGASGSGKSTALRLITGLYSPERGEVSVAGLPVSEWNLEALREQVAVVAQDSFLFPVSVKENIRFGRGDCREEDIEQAAKSAHAHDFVLELASGYDTSVGELGGRLSGGQRQRLSLARAFLRNSPILLLDEATSALDVQSEALVQDALARFGQGKTVIIVAHRLSTIVGADRVIVFDQGKIAEVGTHQELLSRGGIYYALYQNQWATTDERQAV